MSYTTPRIVKGKKPAVPKGSTLEKEWAKNDWYINYTVNGKQYRDKKGINRYKDPKEKQRWANALRQSVEDRLKDGYDPANPEAYIEKLTKQNITLADAINNYLADLAQHAKQNTIDTYAPKLRHLLKAYPDKPLKDITTKDIETFLRSQIHKTEPDEMFRNGRWVKKKSCTKWTQKTVNNAKGIYRTFFNWCVKKEQRYITESPIKDVEKKKIRSRRKAKHINIPYTDQDLKTVMKHLDANDKFVAFFARFIYYSCIRPSEICQLQVKDIDMQRRQITIGLDVMKTTDRTEEDVLSIEPKLFELLEQMNLHQHPDNFYIFSKDESTIVGAEPIHPEKPYHRLMRALQTLNLKGKGYTLYGFKHTSNIARFNAGWTLAEIMKANRHGDLQSTLEYLKDITRTVEITDKEVPAI